MAQWPDALPQTFEPGLVVKNTDQVHRQQMQAGPAKARRQSTAIKSTITGALVCKSQAQVATLETFINTTLGGGAMAFDWVHPLTGSPAKFRLAKPLEYRHKAGQVCVVSITLEELS